MVKLIIKLIPELYRRATALLFSPFKNVLYSVFTRSVIHPLATFDRNIKIGKGSIVAKALLTTYRGKGRIEIGSNTIIYEDVEIFAHKVAKVVIGDHCMIARRACIMTADHIFSDPDIPILKQGTVEEDVVIGNDVWVGYDVKIVKGVTIGDGAVIGAGAVVTKDIPSYSVAVGIPARVVRQRKR